MIIRQQSINRPFHRSSMYSNPQIQAILSWRYGFGIMSRNQQHQTWVYSCFVGFGQTVPSSEFGVMSNTSAGIKINAISSTQHVNVVEFHEFSSDPTAMLYSVMHAFLFFLGAPFGSANVYTDLPLCRPGQPVRRESLQCRFPLADHVIHWSAV